uniref:Uncharacterized protein n=1 Tax=Mimiviridae sp. ChoanoV1 TaxID=2596887 RepID=A0A5B8IQT4_9VIRU|nr:hypothetical protein 6_56 [Mimiviridae sp. ChoanoV1]
MSLIRKPISHYLSWENDFESNSLKDIKDLQDYDVIINEKQKGYRNNGIYIYYDKNIYNLNDYPDDYGCLPEWVELRKEDLGHSYFSDELIYHNTFVPIIISEWKIIYVKIDSEKLQPFQYYYKRVEVEIEFHRERDGAKFTLHTPIIFSATKFNGPRDVYIYKSAQMRDSGGYMLFEYLNGENVKYFFNYNNKYSLDKKMIDACSYGLTDVIITEEHKQDAISLIKEKIDLYWNYLKENQEPVIYLDSRSPRNLYLPLIPLEIEWEWHYNLNMIVKI